MHGHGYLNALQKAKNTVYGPHGERIGTLGNIFMDRGTGDPDYAEVSIGIFGAEKTIVSLEGAEIVKGHLKVAFSKNAVSKAPKFEATNKLDDADKHMLDAYYSRIVPGDQSH